MTLDITSRLASIEPFRYQATPQPVGDQGASSNQINEQQIEDYLNRLRVAAIADIEEIIQVAIATSLLRFTQLLDVPNSYAGAGGQAVAVKAAEDGLEFTSFPASGGGSVERLIFAAMVVNGNAASSTNNMIGYGGALGHNGTIAFGAIASGSVKGAMARRTATSSAIAGSSGSVKCGTAIVLRGSVAGEGGFKFTTYVGSSTALAQQRAFWGLAATTGVIANVNPSSLLNIFGIGYDSAQTTLRVLHNDGAGTATAVDLGANFPVNNSAIFKIELSCQPAASSMEYVVTNLVNGAVASGSINTDLPVATTGLLAHLWINNGTTASAAIMDFTSIIVEMVQ